MFKRLLGILAFVTAVTSTIAQELTVEGMELSGMDLSASTDRRVDNKGNNCALVKVQLAASDAQFEGNIIEPVEFKEGEYWVYMSEGSSQLTINQPDYPSLVVNFIDYAIDGVRSLTTYKLTVNVPANKDVDDGKRFLKLEINIPFAKVYVDDQPQEIHDFLVYVLLSRGKHTCRVERQGYVTVVDTIDIADENITRYIELTERVNIEEGKTAMQSSTLTQQQSSAVAAVSSPSSSSSDSAIETITVNGVSFNMVRVDGGTFTMGATSEQDSDADSDEKPIHRVALSTFSLGETEVTQELWQAVMGGNPSFDKGNNHPVERVSWEGSQKFIQKLNQLTGRCFRLPTEAEWEYAARGGCKSLGYKYSGSNNVDDVAWYNRNSRKIMVHRDGKRGLSYACIRDVKTRRPNELGLYDMSGNVYEWCQDCYGSYSSGSQTNPTGTTGGPFHVFRGGSWNDDSGYCRVSFRYYRSPIYISSDLGFRLAL